MSTYSIFNILLVFRMISLCENHLNPPLTIPPDQNPGEISKLTSEFLSSINKAVPGNVIHVWPRRSIPVAIKISFPLMIRGSERANTSAKPCLINEVGDAPIIEVNSASDTAVSMECLGLRHTWRNESSTPDSEESINSTILEFDIDSTSNSTMPDQSETLASPTSPRGAPSGEESATAAGTCCIGVDGGDVSITECAVSSSAGGTCVGGTGAGSRLRLSRCALSGGAVGVAAFSGCRMLCETSRFDGLREAGVCTPPGRRAASGQWAAEGIFGVLVTRHSRTKTASEKESVEYRVRM